MAIMIVKQRKFAAAVTLIEVMMATAVLVIAATGALSYQYYAARDAKIAHAQITGTRTAKLLLEDWMSTGGSEEYNPATLGLGFSPVSTIPSKLVGFGSPLNDVVYSITVNELPMLVMLTRSDVAYDTTLDVKLLQLTAIVIFGSVSGDKTAQQLELIKPIILTTYVRVDAAGG